MSRTTRPTRNHRHQSRDNGRLRRAFNKGERHSVRQTLRVEPLPAAADALEVLADLYEEQGQLALAEKVRSGHDVVLPVKHVRRVPRS